MSSAVAGRAIVQKIIKHLKTEIKTLESVRSIPEDILLDPAKHMHRAAGNLIAVEILSEQIRYLEGLLED